MSICPDGSPSSGIDSKGNPVCQSNRSYSTGGNIIPGGDTRGGYNYLQCIMGCEVYDINGREVDRIFSGYLSKGKYSMNWLADNQPSGVYFINMISDIRSTTKKVSLIK